MRCIPWPAFVVSCYSVGSDYPCWCLRCTRQRNHGCAIFMIKLLLCGSKKIHTHPAEYVEDRMGLTITSIWRLMVKDIEDTLDSVCDQVCCAAACRLSNLSTWHEHDI